jgi:hypothetical protein
MITETFDRIVKWAKLINAKPNLNCTHFYLSENEKTMIIDLTRMTTMPPPLKALGEKEKSYLFVDLNNRKSVRYYAYDISPKNFSFVGEKDGEILMSAVEDDILRYIEDNISELTNEIAPMSKLVAMNKGDFQKLLPPVQQPTQRSYDTQGYHRSTNPNYPYTSSSSHNNWAGTPNNAYGASYKERELFCDTIYALVKQGKTGSAVDHIREYVNKKDLDKDTLNIILKFIIIDKMDIISLKELIILTEPFKDSLNERSTIIAKFQAMVNKAKPQKAKSLFREIQPNA